MGGINGAGSGGDSEPSGVVGSKMGVTDFGKGALGENSVGEERLAQMNRS
jgi:hypothetical protein